MVNDISPRVRFTFFNKIEIKFSTDFRNHRILGITNEPLDRKNPPLRLSDEGNGPPFLVLFAGGISVPDLNVFTTTVNMTVMPTHV